MITLLDRIKYTLANKSLVKNASPSQEYEGCMIAHWEQKTRINLQNREWACPKCGGRFSREDLDGAHVVPFNRNNTPQFITPLCQTCNREKDKQPFLVENAFLVPAP